jgi:hypothetical protein
MVVHAAEAREEIKLVFGVTLEAVWRGCVLHVCLLLYNDTPTYLTCLWWDTGSIIAEIHGLLTRRDPGIRDISIAFI